MCKDLKSIDQSSATVYKIVAKRPKGKRFYSIAMGFKYPKKGKVPKIRVQHCLGCFDENILIPTSSGYERGMVGRTAGYVNKSDAKLEAYFLDHSYKPLETGYLFHVAKVKLTDDLMSGSYGLHPIIAGKHIESLK